MVSTNLPGRVQTTFLQKLLLPIFQKTSLLTKNFLNTILLPPPLSHPPKLQAQKCFKCLGFRYIAANCPSKRTIMLQEVNQDQIQIKTKIKNEMRLHDILLPSLFYYQRFIPTYQLS